MAADVGSLILANLNEVGKKSLFEAFFDLKILKFEIFSRNRNQITRINQIGEPSLSLTVEPITLFLKILTKFSKIDEKLVKSYGKCE